MNREFASKMNELNEFLHTEIINRLNKEKIENQLEMKEKFEEISNLQENIKGNI